MFLLPEPVRSITLTLFTRARRQCYALSGNSAMLGGLQDEGSIFSTTLDETTTVTENGKQVCK